MKRDVGTSIVQSVLTCIVVFAAIKLTGGHVGSISAVAAMAASVAFGYGWGKPPLR